MLFSYHDKYDLQKRIMAAVGRVCRSALGKIRVFLTSLAITFLQYMQKCKTMSIDHYCVTFKYLAINPKFILCNIWKCQKQSSSTSLFTGFGRNVSFCMYCSTYFDILCLSLCLKEWLEILIAA